MSSRHAKIVAFAVSSLFLHKVADMAVHLILVTTIGQHWRRRDCLATRMCTRKHHGTHHGTHLHRSWWTSAHKHDDSCMDQRQMLWMDENWRWWLTVPPCEEGPRWPLTPPWCVHCTAMGRHDGERTRMIASFSRKERTYPEFLGEV